MNCTVLCELAVVMISDNYVFVSFIDEFVDATEAAARLSILAIIDAKLNLSEKRV